MRIFSTFFVAAAFFTLSFGLTAHAAQIAQIKVDEIQLLDGPGKNYSAIKTLTKGDKLAASNEGTEGYFKVRTEDGKVGWVDAQALRFADGVAESGIEMGAASKSGKDGRDDSYRFMRLRLLGGMTFFSAPSINSVLSFAAIKNGYNYGGEFAFRFTKKFAMIFRVETILKDVIGRDSVSSNTFEFKLSSLPVMTGFEFRIAQKKNFSAHLTALAGLGVNTTLSSTALNLSSPNVTQFRSYTFTSLVKLSAEYELWNRISAYFEGGYRWLESSPVTPEVSGNGVSIWQNASSVNVPILLQLSGPFVSGGVALYF